jgi:hypothetical protein
MVNVVANPSMARSSAVLDFFQNLFNPYGFPPRWHCGLWSSELGWLTILSDTAIWSAYYAIPFVLVYVAYRRKDVPFRPLFWLFGAFILSCGTVHLTDAVIFWWPIYRFMGLIKFITAVVSWATVIALIPVAPQALRLRTPKQLEEEVNRTRIFDGGAGSKSAGLVAVFGDSWRSPVANPN